MLVTALASCKGKADSATATTETPAAGGKKTCEDVGRNGLKVNNTPYIEGQANGYEAWCLAKANKVNQADIDCLATAIDRAAFDKCVDDSVKHD